MEQIMQTAHCVYGLIIIEQWYINITIKRLNIIGPVTRGGTVQLSTRTRVVGNEGDDSQLYDGGQPNPETGIYTDAGDPAVRIAHRFLNYEYDRSKGDPKSQQALHVSLLMTDDPPDEPPEDT